MWPTWAIVLVSILALLVVISLIVFLVFKLKENKLTTEGENQWSRASLLTQSTSQPTQ